MTKSSLSRDYYEALGVAASANQDTIKRAFKKLALRFHPDKNKGKGADEKMKELNAAMEVLGDESKRKEYDEQRHQSRGTTPTAPEAQQAPTADNATTSGSMHPNSTGSYDRAGASSTGRRAKSKPTSDRKPPGPQYASAPPHVGKDYNTREEAQKPFSSPSSGGFGRPSTPQRHSTRTEYAQPQFFAETNRSKPKARPTDIHWAKPFDESIMDHSSQQNMYEGELSGRAWIWLVALLCLKVMVLRFIAWLWRYRVECKAPYLAQTCYHGNCFWRQEPECSWKESVDYATSGGLAFGVRLLSTLMLALIYLDVNIVKLELDMRYHTDLATLVALFSYPMLLMVLYIYWTLGIEV